MHCVIRYFVCIVFFVSGADGAEVGVELLLLLDVLLVHCCVHIDTVAPQRRKATEGALMPSMRPLELMPRIIPHRAVHTVQHRQPCISQHVKNKLDKQQEAHHALLITVTLVMMSVGFP